MEVEQAYSDAKITTIYEGTNEIPESCYRLPYHWKDAEGIRGGRAKHEETGPITGLTVRNRF